VASRALFVKFNYTNAKKDEIASDSFINLDKVAHGLLSQAIYNKILKENSPLLLRPAYGIVDQILINEDFSKKFLDRVITLWGDKPRVLAMGDFTTTEWQHLENYFPEVQKWEDLDV
jgi:hypothetical protein